MTGLYLLALQRIEELRSNNNSRIIRFPRVFEKLCSSFCITKSQAWELLFLFHELGFLEVVPYQGVRVKVSR